MELEREVILFILERGETNERTADTLLWYAAIQRKVKERRILVDQIREDSEKKIASLLAIKWCDHPVSEHYGDPSGGSDSHSACLVCGETVSK